MAAKKPEASRGAALRDFEVMVRAAASWAASDRSVVGFSAMIHREPDGRPSLRLELGWRERDGRIVGFVQAVIQERGATGLGKWVVTLLRRQKAKTSRSYRKGELDHRPRDGS